MISIMLAGYYGKNHTRESVFPLYRESKISTWPPESSLDRNNYDYVHKLVYRELIVDVTFSDTNI